MIHNSVAIGATPHINDIKQSNHCAEVQKGKPAQSATDLERKAGDERNTSDCEQADEDKKVACSCSAQVTAWLWLEGASGSI